MMCSICGKTFDFGYMIDLEEEVIFICRDCFEAMFELKDVIWWK